MSTGATPVTRHPTTHDEACEAAPGAALRAAAPDEMLRDAGPSATLHSRGVAVLSGKGGVGKTNLAAGLALAAAGFGARVLLVDGDLGLANLDVLLGLVPERSVLDVLAEGAGADDALVRGPRGVHLLAAASGRADLASLGARGMERVTQAIAGVAARHDLVLVDAGAGIGSTVMRLAAACGRALVVTTPEPTSLADAYATLKVLAQEAPVCALSLVVSSARDEAEARSVFRRIERLALRFLGRAPVLAGFVPRDPLLVRAVALQRSVVDVFPASPSGRAMTALARRILAASVEGSASVRPIRDEAAGAAPGVVCSKERGRADD